MWSRIRVVLAIAAAMAALLTPLGETLSAENGSTGIMISEFRFSGPAGLNDEFIELYNGSVDPVRIAGLVLRSSTNTDPSNIQVRATIPDTVPDLAGGCYFLLAHSTYSLGATALPDLSYTTGISDEGGIALYRGTTVVDQVGFRSVDFSLTPFFEAFRILVPTGVPLTRSFERKPDPNALSAYQDTDNNVDDFAVRTEAFPQSRRSNSTCSTFTIYTPHDVQGAGAVSPLSGAVRVSGVVTARRANGFFIQTPSGAEDADPQTSEGLFVSATGARLAAAVVGHLVRVTGGVNEHADDPGGPSTTRISTVMAVEDLGNPGAPEPYALTLADLPADGSLDQMERFEGMLVNADLTAVSGSDDAASFFAVLTGQPRPFREPGVHVEAPSLGCAVGPPCNVPVFDGNPERLRVDADGLEGVGAVAVTTGAMLPSVTAVVDFSARNYTLLPTAALEPVVGSGMSIVPAAAAAPDQFTVATLTVGALDATGLEKASRAIRNEMAAPDVVGIQGVNTVGDLRHLAERVNGDAAGAVEYDALPAGDDLDPLGVGVLVRRDHVSEADVASLSTDVFDQAPLVLHATIAPPPARLPQALTVVVSRFAPLTDVDRNDAAGVEARARRQAQAEYLADYLQGLQISAPAAAIVSLGGYNAFDFNDGYVDVVGTLRGLPAPSDQLTNPSTGVVTPHLLNLDDANPWQERYTSLSNGNAQSLDHVLASANLSARFAGLTHVRINADFEHEMSGEASTPKRLSDTDPLVAYFAFARDVEPPVFSTTVDLQVEATGPAGATVVYESPTADDNLDESVVVTCLPVSGSTFAIDNTQVTCSTQDLAGNANSVSFTVTVQDTIAPALFLPSPITAEATSEAGASIPFAAWATDAVTASPSVTCTPASGTTFPVGETPVSCEARDAAGNLAQGAFVVTVTPLPSNTAAGRMAGAGEVVTGNLRTWFHVAVRKSADSEIGTAMLMLRDGNGRPDRFVAARVSNVAFDGDAVTFTATGAWNGLQGYVAQVTAADRGEPGKGTDTFSLTLVAPNGAVVKRASGVLDNGNLQSQR